MKKLTCALLLVLVLGFVDSAMARRGCCSHHGGVCGCKCCDGTPLSAKCSPYYPDCKEEGPTVKLPKDTQKDTQPSK